MKDAVAAIGWVLFAVLVALLGGAFLCALWALSVAITVGVPLWVLVLAYRAAGYVLPAGPDLPAWLVMFIGVGIGVLLRPRAKSGQVVQLRGVVTGGKPPTTRPRGAA